MKKILVTQFETFTGTYYIFIPFDGPQELEDFYNSSPKNGKLVIEVTDEKAEEMFKIQGNHARLQVELEMKFQKKGQSNV